MGGAGGSGGGGPYSESAALVHSTEGMSYTEESRQPGGGGAPHDGGEDELMDCVDSDVSVLAQFHEDAIRQVRQWRATSGTYRTCSGVQARKPRDQWRTN